ncbi:hypothetical protein IFM89_003881 [Coptis chinensis]|uniref:Uncharacterized protein n=1 Tax=Coptis chinensis TaxID=261450 RepID=A0A835M262_9MAGN|nr:hypothetical protein IFM89_003881 [Coptis chinensis]
MSLRGSPHSPEASEICVGIMTLPASFLLSLGGANVQQLSNSSITDVIKTKVKKDGYIGLFRGWKPKMLFDALAVAICWSTYKAGKGFFQELNDSRSGRSSKGKGFFQELNDNRSGRSSKAIPLNPTTNPDAEFDYGAGHIDLVKVVRPGLVYDALEGDYLKFLCSTGYTTEQTKLVSFKYISRAQS